jgi:hypothetical protein
MEPRFRGSPFAHDGFFRDADHFRYFLLSEAAKELQLDDARTARRKSGELSQRLVYCENSFSTVPYGRNVVERHASTVAAALRCRASPANVDQNAPHDPDCRPEEMRPIAPVDTPGVYESKVRVVH